MVKAAVVMPRMAVVCGGGRRPGCDAVRAAVVVAAVARVVMMATLVKNAMTMVSAGVGLVVMTGCLTGVK